MFLIEFFSRFCTKHNWRHNHHNHGYRRGKSPPSPQREALRSTPMLQMDRRQPPKLVDVFWGGLRVRMAFKMLLCSGNDASPQHLSILRAIHTLNSPKSYIRLLKRLLPISCVGQCWRLEAEVRSTYSRNSKNCLQKYFFLIPT